MKKIERKIYLSKPVSYLRKRSKQIVLPGFEDVPLYDIIKFFFTQVKRIGLNDRAAAVAFNFIMAIPAALIFLFTLVPYLPASRHFSEELFRLVRNLTPNAETQKFVTDIINDFFNKPKTGLLSIGFLIAAYYSSNAMMGIIRTFDRSLAERHKDNFVNKRLRAIYLTTLVILVIIGTILISLGQGELFKFIMRELGIENKAVRWWIRSLRWVVIVILFLYSIGCIYKFAPSIQKRWKLLSPGAILATSLTILVTMFFSLWVQNFSNYNRFYGSIGTVLIIMLLIYINSLVLLIGFELNVSISSLKKRVVARKRRGEKENL